MGRILAIDYGLRRCGLAWTDPERRVALPLGGISTAALWEQLSRLIPETEKVILGYPRRMDGGANELTPYVEALEKELRQRYPHIMVERVDERFSTRAAQHILRELPRRQRRQKETSDRIAATILLESYLLRQR